MLWPPATLSLRKVIRRGSPFHPPEPQESTLNLKKQSGLSWGAESAAGSPSIGAPGIVGEGDSAQTSSASFYDLKIKMAFDSGHTVHMGRSQGKNVGAYLEIVLS